jgi:hypothetical protein
VLTDPVSHLFREGATHPARRHVPQARLGRCRGVHRAGLPANPDAGRRRRSGVAKGAAYGYVRKKNALLGAARFADGVEPLPDVVALPVRAAVAGELAALVAERLRNEIEQLRLVEALSKRRRGPLFAELSGIITNPYDTLTRHRVVHVVGGAPWWML